MDDFAEPTPDLDAPPPPTLRDSGVVDELVEVEADETAEVVADEPVEAVADADAEPLTELPTGAVGAALVDEPVELVIDEAVEHAPAIGDAGPLHTPPSTAPIPAHLPKIVFVDVVTANSDEIEVKLADGRSGVIARRDAIVDFPMSPGASIEAAVLARTDAAGRVMLSQKWAHQQRAWEQIDKARAEGTPMIGVPRREVKGGVVVELAGLRAFMPASHSDRPAGSDLSAMFGQELEVAVLEVNRAADRIVVSRRDLVRRQRRASEKAAFGSLLVGSIVTGKVSNFLEFGVQVNLSDGVRGLVHRSELSWSRVIDMSALVAVGDEVSVKVLEVNRSKRRVGLSMRQTQADPLAGVTVGDIDSAVITSVVEYGAFARMVTSGAEGLIHQSELTEQFGLRPDQVVMTGEEVAVKVLDIDLKKRRLGLSVRQAVLS